MRNQFRFITAAAICFAAHSLVMDAQGEDSSAPVQAALSAAETWLGSGATRDGWNQFLNLPALDAEVAKKEGADSAIVAATLKQLNSGAAGLELPHFVKLRERAGAMDPKAGDRQAHGPARGRLGQRGVLPAADRGG